MSEKKENDVMIKISIKYITENHNLRYIKLM